MSIRNAAALALLAYAFLSLACVYVVLPEGLESPEAAGGESAGWSAAATNIGPSDSGGLRIDFTISNETGDWSAMNAIDGEPAILANGGESLECETVFVGTGGHRLAPGFRMRAYTAGTKSEPEIQPIYVECPASQAAAGAALSIPYTYVTGQYDYYEQDKNRVDALLEINLDEIAADQAYPVAQPVDGLIQGTDAEMVAINDVVLTLTGVERTEDGLEFSWMASNPGEYPSYVHIGTPPVVGEDGILYGYYETPDIVSVPITPAGGQAEWVTEVSVPSDVGGFYIMLSVETGKARLFANYAIDVSDQ